MAAHQVATVVQAAGPPAERTVPLEVPAAFGLELRYLVQASHQVVMVVQAAAPQAERMVPLGVPAAYYLELGYSG